MEMSDLHEALIQYMDSMIQLKTMHGKKPKGMKFMGQEDFVKQNGKAFTSQKYPSKYLNYRGEKKGCFTNAFNLAQRFSELTYVEGYGISNVVPLAIHHAFCVDAEGNVVDPTWDDQEDSTYFGVEFNQKYVVDTILRTKYYGILENWIEGYPLFMGSKGHTKKDFSICMD